VVEEIICGDIMAEYDKVLLKMPRDRAVLYLKTGPGRACQIESTEELLGSDYIIPFQAYDIVVNLFEDDENSNKFLVLLGRWLRKVTWSKKILVNKSLEDVDINGNGIFSKLYVVRIRIWVSDEQYANDCVLASRIIRHKLGWDYIDIEKVDQLSYMFNTNGCNSSDVN